LWASLAVKRALLGEERRREMREGRREWENGISTGKDGRARRGAYGDLATLLS
jgi:hypothetical protein